MTIRSSTLFRLLGALLGALVLTKLLYIWPDLLPSSLRDLGNAIIDLSGAQSAEVSSDIELAFVLLVSVLISGIVVMLATVILPRLLSRDDA